jgi:hypothetical protein
VETIRDFRNRCDASEVAGHIRRGPCSRNHEPALADTQGPVVPGNPHVIRKGRGMRDWGLVPGSEGLEKVSTKDLYRALAVLEGYKGDGLWGGWATVEEIEAELQRRAKVRIITGSH